MHESRCALFLEQTFEVEDSNKNPPKRRQRRLKHKLMLQVLLTKFHSLTAYLSLKSLFASSTSVGVNLPGSSWIFSMALNPCASALAIVSGVTVWPNSFWMPVILCLAMSAAWVQLAFFSFRSWNILGKSALRNNVPCWRTTPRVMFWLLPEIFLPLTVMFGQFFASPVLKSAVIPKSLSASFIAS